MLRTLDCANEESPARLHVDSRQYTFSFAIDSSSAIPADFGNVPTPGKIRAGAFVPGGEPDHLGIRPNNPKVVLVTDRELLLLAHPSAGEATVRVPVQEIEGFEWGQMLLAGWVRFYWNGGATQIKYNRRSSGPIEEAIRLTELARYSQKPRGAACQSFGDDLNLKFEYARSAQLLPGEEPLIQFFRPARYRMCRCWGLRRQIWSPGDLLLATTGRLVWITERYDNNYSPYGLVVHTADQRAMAGVEARWTARIGGEAAIAFRSGRTWRVPVQQESESAFWAFIEALQKRLRT